MQTTGIPSHTSGDTSYYLKHKNHLISLHRLSRHENINTMRTISLLSLQAQCKNENQRVVQSCVNRSGIL